MAKAENLLREWRHLIVGRETIPIFRPSQTTRNCARMFSVDLELALAIDYHRESVAKFGRHRGCFRCNRVPCRRSSNARRDAKPLSCVYWFSSP